MDTNKIKRFATEARNKLKEGIAAKIRTLGFDKQGNVAEEHRPQLMQGGTHWNGQLLPEAYYHQWMSLYHRIQQKGISEVYEEAAYTWFNRLCAIRILQKNDLCAPVLDYTDAARTPFIVDEARQGRIPEMNDEMRSRLSNLLDDDTKVTEQFAVLINAWCHDNPIIYCCFGAMADYTELLLPGNILTEGGFVDMLNHTEFITDDDYRSPELIGWLYQFYISERKDEVFAKKGKFEADEIPAATQIFTPNWVVKYMVQNTVGRIYLDNNPYETQLQKKWQYLVEPSEKPTADSILKYEELTDLRVADLACGSGHILNECFDLLYDLYIAEGYSRSEAIENIFRHNLTGVDLDTRAKQLAMFALLLKACQKDAAFADGHSLPHVLDMDSLIPPRYDNLRDTLPHFFLGGNRKAIDEVVDAYRLMESADTLGSIMKFSLSDSTRQLIADSLHRWQEEGRDDFEGLFPGMRLMLALTEKYHALVMNPPYMGSGNMNATLSKYVKEEYEEGKADLATVFVQMMSERTAKNASYAFIIPPSWMFLSTFEKLRKNMIENNSIQSLLHLSRGVFGADFGASSAVIQNAANENAQGTYFRLVERTFQEFEQSHLRMLFEQTLANHDFKYRFKDYTKDVTELPCSEDGQKIYYPNVCQKDFEKIPGAPIGYWVSDKVKEIFTSNLALSAVASPCVGLQTAENARFIRHWFVVIQSRIGFGCENAASAARSQKKWFPHNKGGAFRKWYGNQENVVNWENDGYEIKHFIDPRGKLLSRPQNMQYYFRSSVSWSKIVSGTISFRYFEKGFIFDCAALSLFFKEEYSPIMVLSFLNCKIASYILRLLSPTMNCEVGQIASVPIITKDNKDITNMTMQNISISKQDWDAHETSWDFETNPLLEIMNDEGGADDEKKGVLLEGLMTAYKQKWEHLFMQLHENEEELNRQFIDIYGLQDELTPDVPLDEITILQQGEISFNE